jgi:protein TonB
MTGHETATAPRQGRDSPSLSAAEGNAAASNYPGLVMRHRADTRGAVLVQFSVTEGGRLASVRVARSSGSTRLDRAALTVVERAAPFPAPPAGADRSFSVQIKGE